MKFFHLFIIVCFFKPYTCSSQERYYIYGVFENYFPFDPFESTFSDFFKKLNSDPLLVNKSLRKRTDTSLFSLSGIYYNYDRGILDKTNVEIKLEEIVLPVTDTLSKRDTFFQYQVIYYYDNSIKGPAYVKKIFTQFGKEYHGIVTDMADYDIKENNATVGVTRNYFMQFSPVSPMTSGWMKVNDKESIFTIMVRLKLIQNELVVYVPEPAKSP